ncbi:VOC family protein [Nonomuraea sp. NPDC048826]|uniref:VOC family protein n=1 Tax=Nonomuraea sp. NPDC048826 TaxID=3364347 RepID=UPI003713325E
MSTRNEFAVQPVLSTADVERLKSFYVELFGAEEHLRVPGRTGPFMIELRLGRAGLALVDHKAEGPSAVNVFVADVDALLPRVEPAGGKVLGPAKDMPWGHRVAHVTDPDGNQVNLTQQL